MSYENLYICEHSPTGLRWATNIYTGFGNKYLKAKAHEPAGSEDTRYYEVGVGGKKFWCHRVVWEIANGPITDGKTVDHIDGNGKNNMLSNLRLVDKKVNSRNLKTSVRNTSGVRGVTFIQSKGCWRAHWNGLDGRSKSKHFNINKLGDSEAFNQAVACRADAIERLNESGAGYLNREGHG